MDLIFEGIKKAFWLLVTFDPEVMRITLLSLQISGTATLISLLIGVSTGVTIALSRFPGRRIVVSLINTGMGLPPVVVGLFVTIFLWRNGPLGFLEILYTPDSHDLCPGGHCHSHCHGYYPGSHPAASPETPPPDSGPRGNPPPDGLDPDQGGPASPCWLL